MSITIKPDYETFVLFRFWIRFIWLLIILGACTVILAIYFPIFAIITAGLFLLLVLFNIISLRKQYQRTSYELLDDHLIIKTGGIISERETKLTVKNITMVSKTLPWIQFKFLKTGNIAIQSAGSSGIEALLKSINNTDTVYQQIIQIMRSSGFSLGAKKLIQEEKPKTIAVFFEIFGAVFLFLLIAGPGIIGLLVSSIMALWASGWVAGLISSLVGFIILSLIGLKIVLKFLDLKNRIYRVYEDTITYFEGFLTKHEAFFPIENLSDASTTQTLIDKILGLYDVKVSAPGSENVLLFKNMANADTLEKNIDRLIAKAKPIITKQSKQTNKVANHTLPLNNSFTGEYKMDMTRTIIGSIFWLVFLFPIFFVIPAYFIPGFFIIGYLIVKSIINVSVNKFFVKPDSFQTEYNFIQKRNIELTTKKITSISFFKGIIDRWFNTVSVRVTSIGSGDAVIFKNIQDSEGLRNSFLGKIGIVDSIQNKEKPNFGLGTFFLAHLYLITFLLAVGVIVGIIKTWIPLIGVGILILIVAIGLALKYRHAFVGYGNGFAKFHRGFLRKATIYAPLEYVKNISTIKYPLSLKGTMRVDIAGEIIVTDNKGQRRSSGSNGFTVPYMSDIVNKNAQIDSLLLGTEPQHQSIVEGKSSIANSFPGFIILIVLWGVIYKLATPAFAEVNEVKIFLLAVLGIAVVLFMLRLILISSRRYSIHNERIIALSGIIYKKTKTILRGKIDHVGLNRGMFNKIFKNASISINTAGSSITEMRLINTKNYSSLYEELKD